MKPSLQLKFSQQLTMTPQLQQAIKLLQLSTLDLQQEIQEALDSNPLLEVDDNSDNDTVEKSKLDAEADAVSANMSASHLPSGSSYAGIGVHHAGMSRQ